jgi:hypothetical protein
MRKSSQVNDKRELNERSMQTEVTTWSFKVDLKKEKEKNFTCNVLASDWMEWRRERNEINFRFHKSRLGGIYF